MKRVMLALLGLVFVASVCMAQNWQTRVQRGTATQQLQAPGLAAAHSGIPVGSKVKITNPANGLEIEATIVSQIPESYNRIIDLSASAALALGLGAGGPVLVTTLTLPPVVGATPPPPPPPPPPEPVVETEPEPEKPQLPFNIIINNYIKDQEGEEEIDESVQVAPPPPAPQQAYVMPQPFYSPQPPAYAPPATPPSFYAQQPQPAAPSVYTPVLAPLYTSPPVPNIQIIPGLPSPNTDKVYRLLVGTYYGVESAFIIYQQLQAAGFDVVQEQAGDMCKVFAAGVPASRVYYAAQRLGAIGFQQVWIHE